MQIGSGGVYANQITPQRQDSLTNKADSVIDTLSSLQDSTKTDTTAKRKSSLTDIVITSNKDSLIYDVRANRLKMYTEGDVKYQDNNIRAEYIEMQIDSSIIYAYGKIDTASGEYVKPQFTQGGQIYNMDTVVYNTKSDKMKVKGVVFEESGGFIRGKQVKKTSDGIMNIGGGIYTTCDAEDPHFYLKMSKAQLVDSKNGKKVIIGPSYLYLEDVPLPLVVPFGFFPVMSERNSGFILPEIGEDTNKGMFVTDGGYYFVFNDYMDLSLTAGIYTMGSWESNLSSTYKKRYKYSGSIGIDYSKTIYGEKDDDDYTNMSNYRIQWTHSQDSKFKPNSTFSASVNFTSSKYNQYDASSLSDYVSSQTNSSIAYSKTWAGTPLSFSTNIQQSMNNQDSSVMLSLPNFTLSASKIFPFRRSNVVGKLRWYENIGFTYTGTYQNSVTTKQDQLFSSEMFDAMQMGMKHSIPVSTTMTLLKYFNVTPSVTYNERWYLDKVNKSWDPTEKTVVTDTVSGFYRAYDYSAAVGVSTMLYGMLQFKGKDPAIQAIRHVLTPSLSASYSPNFGAEKYGYYKYVQSDSTGSMTKYSVFENGVYGSPSSGESASMSLSLSNNLEMKVRSQKDTTGYKKVKIFESLSASGSYNFLADSMNLSTISLSARTTLFNSLGINLSGTLDPYAVNSDGVRINRYAMKDGNLARLTNVALSFGYSFRSVFGLESGTGSDALAPQATQAQQDFFNENDVSLLEQQQYLNSTYYDFSVPWNLSFSYNLSYSKPLNTPSVTQTLSFNGSVNLTSKFGITFSGGYDFESNSLTPGTFNMTRDLHCWQMTFSWIPVGFRKSWSFTIRVKSGMLSDLKYEKSSGYLDSVNYYD